MEAQRVAKRKRGAAKKATKRSTSKPSIKAKRASKVAGASKHRRTTTGSAATVRVSPEVVVPGLAKKPPEGTELPEIAFYYPNPYWYDVDWARNLILFFDGIGMLIPNYMSDASRFDDLAVIEGLKQHRLFHVFQPESFLDKDAATRLEAATIAIVDSGALDRLQKEEDAFGTLSMSRMGFHVAEDSANRILAELKKRNLARDSDDGVSIPMHTTVRYLILVLLAQILRDNGRKAGFELLPATDRPLLVSALAELLSQRVMPSAEHVISLDMQAVGVDLGSVPIDEILSYRAENRELYRKYARQLKQTVHELSLMPSDIQDSALEQRQDEIESLASDIRKRSRKAWKKPAIFVLSAAGALWRLYRGDAVGASLAGASALLSVGNGESVETGAYSYLFSAKQRFAW
jgi:hypothetical protein